MPKPRVSDEALEDALHWGMHGVDSRDLGLDLQDCREELRELIKSNVEDGYNTTELKGVFIERLLKKYG